MNKIFRRNENRSQKLKPITLERASYCIQFEIGTETAKILNFIKVHQSSEQTTKDLSEMGQTREQKN